MKSRMEKYYEVQPQYNRTRKNANLYKEVYGNYASLDNLPIADNTNEINLDDLQRIVKSSNETPKRHFDSDPLEFQNQKKNDTPKEYDINKILEQVKNNNKPKEQIKKEQTLNYKFLSTLESQELPISEVRKAYQESSKEKNIELSKKEQTEELYMTREIKFHDKQLEVTREIETIRNNEDLSPLDLFEDLKPDGNTFISEPVHPKENSIFNTTTENEKVIKSKHTITEILSDNKEDNSDINIIKQETIQNTKEIDNDFYTSSYKFSKNDFIDDDEFYDKPNKVTSVIKIFLLLIAIFALTAVIYYFINKYGIGI